MKILVVEDEAYMAEAMEHILKRNNYSVDLAYDGEYGLECGLSGIYDIIVLDIMLPKKDGIAVLKELRKNNVSAPVILLTAKSETEDKVLGLDSGADDYLSKPFQTEELLARLRALGRRKGEPANDNILRYGDIELNPFTLNLSRSIDNSDNSDNSDNINNLPGESLKLTLKESQLLELLINKSNIAVSKNAIIEKLWGYDTDAEDNHVEVYISFLRKKLNHIQSNVSIQTVRNLGYTLKT